MERKQNDYPQGHGLSLHMVSHDSSRCSGRMRRRATAEVKDPEKVQYYCSGPSTRRCGQQSHGPAATQDHTSALHPTAKSRPNEVCCADKQ